MPGGNWKLRWIGKEGVELWLNHEVSWASLVDQLKVSARQAAPFLSGKKVKVNMGPRADSERFRALEEILGQHGIEAEKIAPPAPGERVEWVRQTLRSGQKVVTATHVVVTGDVNPGARVEAGGNVVIFGSLRGTVIFGEKVRSPVLACLSLKPQRFVIAGEEATGLTSERPCLVELADGRPTMREIS